MNINEENKDLIENRIPFGLLDAETKDRMRNWRYGHEVWSGVRKSDMWSDDTYWPPSHTDVFRAKPAPERREYFVNFYPHGVMHHDTLTSAAKENLNDTLISVLKIAFDADGSNPTIEVIEVED